MRRRLRRHRLVEPGERKDAIAPKIRINETTNEWEISTDGGNTWTSTHVAATGEDGDTLIESIETADDGNSVTITLTGSDTPIVLPTWQWAESIEEDIAELNGQLEAYAGLMQGKLLITGVKPTENGQTITYITVDADGKPSAPQSFTITNGKDGEKGDDGATPTVEIKEGYWYINGEPTNIPATGENGKTPEFTLDDEGNLSYHFGDGQPVSLGNIKGPQGDKGEQGAQGNDGKDGVFTGITYTPGDATAVLKLTDGTTIEVAIYQPLTIGEGTGTLTVAANGTTDITLTIPDNVTALMAQITPEGSGGTFTDLDTRAVSGWSVEAKLDEQKVTVTTSSASGKALLDVSLIRADGSKVTASRVLEAINLVTAEMTEITAAGNYLLTGSRNTTLTINGTGINLTLDGATINASSGPAINITGGTPTIHVTGENTIETRKSLSNCSACIYVAEGSSVTIEGSGTDDVLQVTGGADGAAIGGYYDNGDKPCGNIVIKNVTLHAYAIGNYVMAIAPGIGATGGTCGRIEISSAIVYARSFGDTNYSAPAIGAYESVPEIVITDSEIHAYRGSYNGTSYADYIG